MLEGLSRDFGYVVAVAPVEGRVLPRVLMSEGGDRAFD